jgi:hypothetical protein
MVKPRQPERAKGAKSGVEPGTTPSTDKTRVPKRPIEEEDIFGGVERSQRGQPVEGEKTKP